MTGNIPLPEEGHQAPSALVVEDNPFVAETIADGLHKIGYGSVETVSSVDAALNTVSEEKLDVAVVEIDVKGGSTEPVLDALDAKNVAHVVASCHPCNPLPGDAPYLQKPFGLGELRSAVDQARYQASIRSWKRLR